jgi:hypothetical protein
MVNLCVECRLFENKFFQSTLICEELGCSSLFIVLFSDEKSIDLSCSS